MASGHIHYKAFHEEFMRNHNGTTIWENFAIITPSCVFTLFACIVSSYIASNFEVDIQYSALCYFIADFFVLIIPLVLNFSLFTNYSYVSFFSCIAVLTLYFLYFLNVQKGNYNNSLLNKCTLKPFISYFRAIVNLITAICILAVDFQIFPRRFAKTENFGYGLMDTGVGFYVVTNGIVTKPNEIKDKKLKFIIKCFINIIPLLILGCVRFLTVTAVDYQTHNSEYGVHWNFFFTLAFIKLFSSLILTFGRKRLNLLVVLLILVHQCSLSFGLQDWAMDSIDRNNIITANREGLISLPGYLALFLASVIIGGQIRQIKTVEDRKKYIFYLLKMFILFLIWTLISEYFFNISRRFANITYILWMLGFSIYIITLCLVLELSIVLYLSCHKPSNVYFVPNIITAINYNGLTFFLLANLFTGIVNKSFHTLHLSDIASLFILIIYMFVTCGIIATLYHLKIQLKFW